LVIGGLALAFRVTLGVGLSRPCSPWPLPWPAGQERFGEFTESIVSARQS